MKNFKKKLGRKLSVLLAMAMLISMMSGMAAFAAGDPTLIDESEKGSITVHKSVTTSDNISVDATGTTSDATSVENGPYQDLEGAKFMLYQITGADVMDYYNGLDQVSYTIDKVAENGTQVGETGFYVHAVDAKDGSAKTVAFGEGTEKTTGPDGVCSFTGLDLGIYVLVETDAPEYINLPYSEPCLISVPMVNTETSKNDNSWLYNVHVYPKNYDTAKIVLTKYEDDETTPLGGVTFELYKEVTKADDSKAWEKVTATNNTSGTSVPLTLETDDDGGIEIAGLASGLNGTQYKLVEVSAPAAYIVNQFPLYFTVNANSTITYNPTATSGTLDENGDCKADDGSYVNANHDVITAEETMYPATLTFELRNPRPMLSKLVKQNADDGADTWAKDTQYSLSEGFTYQIISYVPKNIAEISYVITDTPDPGITDAAVTGEGNYVVTVADAVDGSYGSFAADNYKLTQVDNGFSFELTADGKTAAAGKYIQIVYKANMNADAVIAQNGNGNKAELQYSKNVDGTASSTDVFSITDESRVYSYQFKITKYENSIADGNQVEPTATDNCKFLVYTNDDKDTPIELIKIADGQYRVPYVGETTDTVTEVVLDADGSILISGLEKGTYWMKEIETITGFNLISDLIEIDLNIKETTTWDETGVYDENGKVVKTYTSTTYTMGEGTSLITLTDDSDDDVTLHTTRELDLVQKKGFVLPKTGSMGFLLFCIIGLALILGGAALMFAGRKKIR